ncbi:MAG: hypothetical protein ACPGII_10405 [Opitutales bacterium]
MTERSGKINRKIINTLRVIIIAVAISTAFSVQCIWDELDLVEKKLDSQQRRIDAQYDVILKQARVIDVLIHNIQKLNGVYTEVEHEHGNGSRSI